MKNQICKDRRTTRGDLVMIVKKKRWSVQFEADLLKYPESVLSACDKMVFITLNAHANSMDGASTPPTLSLIADEASVSMHQIHESLSLLEEKGFIKTSSQVSEIDGKVNNLYEILEVPLSAVKKHSPSTTGQETLESQ